MVVDLTTWPRIPAGEPAKPLYLIELLPDELQQDLNAKGWAVTDVRVMPCANMIERQKVVLAYLEGVRQGTIEITPRLLDFLDLEAQISGLKTGKAQTQEEKKIDSATLETLLDFRNHRIKDGIVKEKPKK